MSITARTDATRKTGDSVVRRSHMATRYPGGKINTTDLDSRNVKTPRSYTQGYNVQAVVTEEQIVLADKVSASSPDFGHLEPMVKATKRELQAIGVTETLGAAVADSGTGMSSRWTMSWPTSTCRFSSRRTLASARPAAGMARRKIHGDAPSTRDRVPEFSFAQSQPFRLLTKLSVPD